MKIKISFKDWERRWAVIAVTALRRVLPVAKEQKCDRYAPVFQTYLTVNVPVENGKVLQPQEVSEKEIPPSCKSSGDMV